MVGMLVGRRARTDDAMRPAIRPSMSTVFGFEGVARVDAFATTTGFDVRHAAHIAGTLQGGTISASGQLEIPLGAYMKSATKCSIVMFVCNNQGTRNYGIVWLA